MTKFLSSNEQPEPEKRPGRIGMPLTGAFECDCGEVVTQAINVRSEEKVYWTCSQGHENSIHMKL